MSVHIHYPITPNRTRIALDRFHRKVAEDSPDCVFIVETEYDRNGKVVKEIWLIPPHMLEKRKAREAQKHADRRPT